MTQERLSAHFVESAAGRIFLLLREPAPDNRSGRCVLFVPPFAEEMNKSRRQMTETANLLVTRGLSVLLLDLYGTGDSEGEFAEASWATWKADIATAFDWAGHQNLTIDALVATRLGCALAAESLSAAGLAVENTVFWQPVESGRQFVTQFLRLRVAASLMEADRKETVDGLRDTLGRGEAVEVAGYALSPGLWQSLEQAQLSAALHPGLGRVRVIEIGRTGSDELTASGKRLLETAAERGLDVLGRKVAGEPFWTATEIVVNPGLSEITAGYL